MNKYIASDKALEALDIKTKELELISDKDTINKYDKILLSGGALPENVIKVKKGEKKLDNSSFLDDLDSLPENVTKEPIKITNEKELDKIRHLHNENSKLPNNIIKEWTPTGYTYYYADKYDYYKDLNEYYDVEHLDDAIIDGQIQVESVKSFKSIASSLLFFKYVTIALFSISVFILLIQLLATL